MPNHEEFCVLWKRPGRSFEIYKLSSHKLKILYFLMYTHILMFVYSHMHVLVCRVDAQ